MSRAYFCSRLHESEGGYGGKELTTFLRNMVGQKPDGRKLSMLCSILKQEVSTICVNYRGKSHTRSHRNGLEFISVTLDLENPPLCRYSPYAYRHSWQIFRGSTKLLSQGKNLRRKEKFTSNDER